MPTTTQLKKLLFSMVLKTSIWLVHLAANQSSANEHTYSHRYIHHFSKFTLLFILIVHMKADVPQVPKLLSECVYPNYYRR